MCSDCVVLFGKTRVHLHLLYTPSLGCGCAAIYERSEFEKTGGFLSFLKWCGLCNIET